MQRTIYDSWSVVMNHNKNPLKNIPDTQVRHMIMQVLAWMWCIVFSMYFSSMWMFGITTIAHTMLLGAIAFTVLTYTMPVWATIFATIFGYEKINLSIVISLILGMIGIFFLSIEINIFENLFGFLITLSAGLSWAIGTMIVKYGGIKSDGLIVAGWQQIIGIIPIIPFALYFDLNNFGEIELKHILIIFYGIFFSSAYTYWAYFTVLQKFSVNITSISVMAVPVLAVLIDYLTIDFPFSTLDLLALIFIISGIYIAATKPFTKR